MLFRCTKQVSHVNLGTSRHLHYQQNDRTAAAAALHHLGCLWAVGSLKEYLDPCKVLKYKQEGVVWDRTDTQLVANAISC